MHETTSTPTAAAPSARRPYYPAKSAEDRLAALRALRGMWKGRDPDPVTYFKQLRDASERALPERRG